MVKGVGLHISQKHAMNICRFIKGKSIDKSISELEEVSKLKRAIPFRGEIAHRRGIGPGKYPVNASLVFIKLLKSLKGNVIVNQMDLEKTKIYIASTARSFRPMKSGSRMAKRCHVLLKAREMK